MKIKMTKLILKVITKVKIIIIIKIKINNKLEYNENCKNIKYLYNIILNIYNKIN